MADFGFVFDAHFNLSNFDSQIKKAAQMVKSIPAPEFSSMKAGVEVGDAKAILETLKQRSMLVDKIAVTEKKYQNSSKETYTQLSSMVVEYRNKLGEAGKEIYNITNLLGGVKKGFKEVASYAGTIPVGKEAQKVLKVHSDRLKMYERLTKKAEEWSTRANTYERKEKDAIKATSTALLAKITEYNKLNVVAHPRKAKALAEEIDGLAKSFNTSVDATKRSANSVRSWSDNIANALKQTVSYTFSLGLLRTAQNFLNQGLQYAIELNKEMVKIQVLQAEGARSPEEIRSLASGYNDLAKQLGATTIEVAQGSVEWLRQGKTIAETQELLVSSTMLAKLGNLSVADATEYLTSTVNSYRLSTEEAISVVDKLIAVDNESATSAREMATALRYSAAAADGAGVSLEQLISYIATVSSTTRQNAESIGQAMKTLMARMTDIKAGAIDEDGLGINNVERALARVNVTLRESDTEWRDMGDVLEDIAKKWDTLNDIEQANIAKAVAGVRQQNLFAVLMQNMGEALRYQAIQTDAAGISMDRYKIYLEGVEAAQNRLKASVEGLWQDAISTGLITNVLNATIAIVEFIDATGGLNMVLGTTILLFSALQMPSLITWLKDVTIYFKAAAAGASTLTEALIAANLAALPYVAAAAAVLVLVAVIVHASKAHERLVKAAADAATAMREANVEYKRQEESLENVTKKVNEYNDLLEKQRKGLGLTADEAQRLTDIQNELHEKMGGALPGSYDENLNFIIDAKFTLEDILQLEKDILEEKRKQMLLSAEEAGIAESVVLESLEKQIKKLKEELKSGTKIQLSQDKSSSQTRDLTADEKKEIEGQIQAKEKQYQIHANNMAAIYNSDAVNHERYYNGLTLTGQEYIDNLKAIMADQAGLWNIEPRENVDFTSQVEIEELQRLQDELNRLMENKELKMQLDLDEIEILDGLAGAYEQNISETDDYIEKILDEIAAKRESIRTNSALSESSKNALLGLSGSAEDASKAAEALAKNQKMLNDVLTEYNKTGALTIAQVTSLADAGYALAISTDTKTGAQTLNLTILRQLVLAEAEFAAVQAHAAYMQEASLSGDYAKAQALYVKAQAQRAWVEQLRAEIGAVVLGGVTPYQAPSGSSDANSAERKRIEAEIEALEKKKKALDDKLDKYKRYIDNQKESLRLTKEEAEFNDKLEKKNKALAKLKTDIIMLSLDDSEAAQAERLRLEEQAADLEEEIAEDKEDRKYNLQIDALNKLQEAFELKIKKQQEGIDRIIDKLRKESSELQSVSNNVQTVSNEYQNQLPVVNTVTNGIISLMEKQIGKIRSELLPQLTSVVDRWLQIGVSSEVALSRAMAYYLFLQQAGAYSYPELWRGLQKDPGEQEFHNGGIAETHHEGSFAGNLKSNEVFARLLKGELVATENDMDTFMKTILPKIASYPMNGAGTPTTFKEDVYIDVDINVEGSVDKKMMPDLKDAIADTILDVMKKRGVRRNASSFST